MTYASDGYHVYTGRIPKDMVERARVDAYAVQEMADRYERTHVVGVHRYLSSVQAIVRHLPAHTMHEPAITHSKFSVRVSGSEFSWRPHQDSAYKPEPRYGVAFVVPLEPCDESNGTLEVIPRSHLLGALPHRSVGEQLVIDAPMIDVGPAVALTVDPGDVVAMHLNTVHQSGRNRRGGLRAMLFVEVEPYKPGLLDGDDGKPPVMWSPQ